MTIYPGEHKILLSNSVIIALAGGGGGRTTLCGGSHLLAKGDTFGDFSMRKTNWGRGGGEELRVGHHNGDGWVYF